MKKFFRSVACATLLCGSNLNASTTSFMNEPYNVPEVRDEKKNDKDNVVLVIELDAHTEIIETRMSMPVIGAGLTDGGQLKIWSDVQLQARVEIMDADGMTVASDFCAIAPGSPFLLSLAGLSNGVYRIQVTLTDGTAYSGIFML